MRLGLLVMLLAVAPALAGAVSPPAHPDSVAAPADSASVRWGAIPPRSPSNTSAFTQPPRPDWEAALMPIYYTLGFPFRVVHVVGDQAVTGLDKLGIFDLPPSEYAGLPGPFGTYTMPVFAIESLEGTKIGADVLRPNTFGHGNMLQLKLTTTTRKAQMGGLGMWLPLGPTWDMQLGLGSEEIQTVRYYGLGPDSQYGDRSYYYRRAGWGGFELDRNIGKKFALEFRTYFSRVRARESRYEVHGSLGNVHDELPPGYPGESNGWTFRLALKRDTTVERARPQSGSFGSGGVSFFESSDGSALAYTRYRLEYERFFPLWYTGRTLALRGFFNHIHQRAGSTVPFTRMVTFSSPDELRGYQSLRFYGLGSVGLSLEYRWPIWISKNRDGPGLDAYLFSDNGQVYMDRNEISWNNVQFTGGAGLRLLGDGGRFSARLEMGWSDEEPIVRLKFNQNFQDNRKVMYDVKDPTRYR